VPFKSWNNVSATSGNEMSGYCTHISVLFPTWHRPYVSLYEVRLRRTQCFSPRYNSRFTPSVTDTSVDEHRTFSIVTYRISLRSGRMPMTGSAIRPPQQTFASLTGTGPLIPRQERACCRRASAEMPGSTSMVPTGRSGLVTLCIITDSSLWRRPTSSTFHR
jgi:hypothetical protein